MGQIFKAHDPDIGRPVAIKLISTELMSSAGRAEYIKRFRREAQAAARCAHPNIVAIYDFALHEGQPFIAMEFVYGASLRQALDAAPVMAVPDAVRIMLQVLDALASAHDQGVIHQDVKPANIMLTPDMRVKVADFGICRFVNTEVTMTTSSMGTPNYMSPEQCRGGPVDGRSDLFAAGATLFEMVAGERAFPGHNVARGHPSHPERADCRCCRRLFAPWRPGCSWCSSGPWESSRRIVSIPATRWRRPCGRCLAAAAAMNSRSTRVSPMPVAGGAARAESAGRRPARDRAATRCRYVAGAGAQADGLCRPDRPHPGAHDVRPQPVRRRPLFAARPVDRR